MKVINSATNIEFQDDAGNSAVVMRKDAINSVSAVFTPVPDGTINPNDVNRYPNNKLPAIHTLDGKVYPYPNMCKIVFIMQNSGQMHEFDIQAVTNQATWTPGNQTGLNVAIASIQSWL